MCGDSACKIYFVVQNKWSQALEYGDALKEFLVFPTVLYKVTKSFLKENKFM